MLDARGRRRGGRAGRSSGSPASARGTAPTWRGAWRADDLAPFSREAADAATARPRFAMQRRLDAGRGVTQSVPINERKPPWLRAEMRMTDDYLALEEDDARPRPAHRVRGSRLSEHLRVLAGRHGHVHDQRRAVHTRVRVLLGRHPPSASRWIPTEPDRVAEAVERMGLQFAVVTAVARDDLDDGGAAALRRHGRRDP